nr:hypothetical protein [Methanosarcina siciliae]
MHCIPTAPPGGVTAWATASTVHRQLQKTGPSTSGAWTPRSMPSTLTAPSSGATPPATNSRIHLRSVQTGPSTSAATTRCSTRSTPTAA